MKKTKVLHSLSYLCLVISLELPKSRIRGPETYYLLYIAEYVSLGVALNFKLMDKGKRLRILITKKKKFYLSYYIKTHKYKFRVNLCDIGVKIHSLSENACGINIKHLKTNMAKNRPVFLCIFYR